MTHLNAPIRNLGTSLRRLANETAEAAIWLADTLTSLVVKASKLLWCFVASILELVRSI